MLTGEGGGGQRVFFYSNQKYVHQSSEGGEMGEFYEFYLSAENLKTFFELISEDKIAKGKAVYKILHK